MSKTNIINTLIGSKELAIRLKTYLKLLEHDYGSNEVKKLTKNIKTKSRVYKSLFSHLPKKGEIPAKGVYHKWYGVHWILYVLADLGYPPGDLSLIPSRNFELDWLFSDQHWLKKPTIDGRKRFCASMEGNALYSLLYLKLDDGRCSQLADRLIKYQWDDGGWNCDKKPKAINSSYNESLFPLRSLNLYSSIIDKPEVKIAINRAAEVFLKRDLYKNMHTGEIINPKWIKLSYPPYWHYEILSILKVLAEANRIKDKRCNDALDLLEKKRLDDGGFPAEARYYLGSAKSNISPVDWGGVNKRKSNPWVTLDALYVLKKAGRIDLTQN
ncbi:hypothetical protein DSAG12_03765 [Promethearchaeum syntrophicum]|uniref:Prenyltransferase and squalene oxidase repeat protein n=1 Tax=Promethearchaeum syntrophicum TaxID=2594042 RepID=A0A5B9DGY7_9ARCH|nr:hypothetical protein [Candidatus Prometheoarchaeum syntrophicum]